MRRLFRVAVVLFLLAILLSGSATVLSTLDGTILAAGLFAILCVLILLVAITRLSKKK